MPYTLNANQCPSPIAKPTTLLDTNAASPSPAVSTLVSNGDTTTGVTKINRNSTIADAGARAQGYGIVQGLGLALASGATIKVKAGQALLDGPVTLSSDTIISLVDGINYIWLRQTGGPTHVPYATGLTPPTTAPCAFLGTVTVASGSVTTIDYSGVVYVLDGALWRATNDVGAPNDTPPSDMALYTRTQAGLWIWDGTAHTALSVARIAGFKAGVPSGSQIVHQHVFSRPAAIVLGMAIAQAYAATAAAASTVFSIRKNGTQFATATFASSSHVAVFANTTATSFAAGDVLQIVAPSSPDASLADVSFSLEAIQ